MKHNYEYKEGWLLAILGGGTAFAKKIPINAIQEDIEILEMLNEEGFKKHCQDDGWLIYDYYSGTIYSTNYKIPVVFRTQFNSTISDKVVVDGE